MKLLAASLVFILGASIGSFLSAMLFRLKNKKTKFLARSICPACKKKLKVGHLLPILSFLILRGKCGYCGKKISYHYLLLEIVTSLGFLTIFLKWNFLLSIPSSVNPEFVTYAIDFNILSLFVFYVIEFSFLIGIFFYDLLYKEIPDSLSLPAIAIAIVGGISLNQLSWENMLIGSAAIFSFFLLQFLLSKGTWIGGGDLRLGILMGALLGFEKGVLALVIAYFIGAIFSIYLLARAKVNRKSQIPFGPFLVIGIYISLFYGERILDYYFNSILV